MSPADILAAVTASPELQALLPDSEAIAAAMSVGRQRLAPTEIGVGTILETLAGVGKGGGVFLDTLTSVGASSRDVYWTMVLINKGTLRIDKPAVRAGMQGLAAAVPSLARQIDALLTLGYEPDPVTQTEVQAAIFNDDGTLKV